MYNRDAVRFFDVAHEGAFIRSATAVVNSGVATDIASLRPRSFIVIAADDISAAAARLGCAALEPLPLPVTVCDQLPRYAGPLDVVLVASSKSVAVQERSLHEAARRGCPTLLIAPAQGPLRTEAPSDVFVLPVPPTAVGGSPASVVATMFAVVASLSLPTTSVIEQLELAADAVDEELLAVSPERDELVNEARQLRAFVGDGRIVHTGQPGKALALANLVSAWWTSKGLPSATIGWEELGVMLAETGGNENDVFYDPFEDPQPAVLPLKIVIWAQQEAHLPQAIAQSSGNHELTLEDLLRLMVRGLAAAVM